MRSLGHMERSQVGSLQLISLINCYPGISMRYLGCPRWSGHQETLSWSESIHRIMTHDKKSVVSIHFVWKQFVFFQNRNWFQKWGAAGTYGTGPGASHEAETDGPPGVCQWCWENSEKVVTGAWRKDGKHYEMAGSLAKLSPAVTLKLKIRTTNWLNWLRKLPGRLAKC